MEISLHSNKKHIALGYYLRIIKDLIASTKTPFKKLYYADLFCGDGSCICEETGKKWDPPIIHSLLKPAKEKGIPICCFLNDIDPTIIEKMKENTKEYKDFIDDYSSKDANEYYKEVLEKIPADQFSLFFLDPYNHTQLKWKTIKEISEHAHSYTNKRETFIRKPELVINFMTYTMLGSYKASSYDSINEAIGTNKWEGLIDMNRFKKVAAPVENALLSTFIEQLKSLGYVVPTPIKITNTVPANTVYYLIWATNQSGYKIIEVRVIPYIKKLMDKTQEENITEREKAKNRKNGMSPLFKYCNN